MIVKSIAAFERDVKKLHDPDVKSKLLDVIEALEAVDSIWKVPQVKKVHSKTGDYYRIRIGDYRVGILLLADVCNLMCIKHRREIYRKFPPR